MRIGTTPVHTFTLPREIAEQVAKVRAIYCQNGNVILKKETQELEGNHVVFKLTQEDTFLFSPDEMVQIQLRVLTKTGDALTSNVVVGEPYICLENEVFA